MDDAGAGLRRHRYLKLQDQQRTHCRYDDATTHGDPLMRGGHLKDRNFVDGAMVGAQRG